MNAPYLDWLQAQPAGQLVEERRGGGFLTSLGGRMISEHRTATQARQRPRPRNRAELNAYVRELLACQPRTPTGYRARLAAIEELCRQADAIRYPAR